MEDEGEEEEEAKRKRKTKRRTLLGKDQLDRTQNE